MLFSSVARVSAEEGLERNVCGLKGVRARLTDRNHALPVVIQVLPHNLQQPLNPSPPIPPLLAPVPNPPISPLLATQVPVLDLHLPKRNRQPPHDPLKRPAVAPLLHHDAKVEHELVARVLLVRDEDGVADDDMLARGVGRRHEAVAEGLAGDDVGLEMVEV